MRASSPWTLSSPLLFLFSWPTRDQSQSPITWPNLKTRDQSQSPNTWTNLKTQGQSQSPFTWTNPQGSSFSNTWRDVQDGKLLHPLLKRGLNPPFCLWVITPPEVADEVDHSGRLACTCPGMPARHDCRPCVSLPYPGQPPGPGSRLLPITHAQLITSYPFNLSVGQSCLHFIFPLISNYPLQYPKSHNLGFHQHPLHDTRIKPSQLALNSSPPYNQTISSSQNTMFIIDNKHSLPNYT